MTTVLPGETGSQPLSIAVQPESKKTEPGEPQPFEVLLPAGYLEKMPGGEKERGLFVTRGVEFFLGFVEAYGGLPENRWKDTSESLEVLPLPSQQLTLDELASRYGVPVPNMLSRGLSLYCEDQEERRKSET